jgi:hypothetical protein
MAGDVGTSQVLSDTANLFVALVFAEGLTLDLELRALAASSLSGVSA